MNTCPVCCASLGEQTGVCSYHDSGKDSVWCRENRMWCDFFHRGIEPPPVAKTILDDYYAQSVEAITLDVA